MVKSVRIFKQLKSELYNWHQVLNIMSDFTFIIALIIATFDIIAMAIQGYPFVMALCVSLQGSKYIVPN